MKSWPETEVSTGQAEVGKPQGGRFGKSGQDFLYWVLLGQTVGRNGLPTNIMGPAKTVRKIDKVNMQNIPQRKNIKCFIISRVVWPVSSKKLANLIMRSHREADQTLTWTFHKYNLISFHSEEISPHHISTLLRTLAPKSRSTRIFSLITCIFSLKENKTASKEYTDR